MTSIDVLSYLSNTLGIKEYRLIRFPNWKLLQDYLSNSSFKTDLLRFVNERICQNGIPFWDAALLYVANNADESEEIVSNADHHNKITTDFWIPSSTISLWTGEKGFNIGINSKVITSERVTKHLPMMDFHISVSPKNEKIIRRICIQLGVKKGFILNSGKSYHFIGEKLITQEEVCQFLSRALLYGPIVDVRWIAHQLIEGSCTLRIGEKNGMVPFVVDEL